MNSRKFVVAKSRISPIFRASGRGYAGFGREITRSLDAFVARNCGNLLRLATDKLLENFPTETTTVQRYSLLSNPSTKAPLRRAQRGIQSRGGGFGDQTIVSLTLAHTPLGARFSSKLRSQTLVPCIVGVPLSRSPIHFLRRRSGLQ